MEPTHPPKVRIRGMILTAGVAAITMVGTFYGAGLKSSHEAQERKKQAAAIMHPSTPPTSAVPAVPAAPATPAAPAPASSPEDDFVAALLTRRRALEQSKQMWEKKAKTLRERMEAKSRQEGSKNDNAPGK